MGESLIATRFGNHALWKHRQTCVMPAPAAGISYFVRKP